MELYGAAAAGYQKFVAINKRVEKEVIQPLSELDVFAPLRVEYPNIEFDYINPASSKPAGNEITIFLQRKKREKLGNIRGAWVSVTVYNDGKPFAYFDDMGGSKAMQQPLVDLVEDNRGLFLDILARAKAIYVDEMAKAGGRRRTKKARRRRSTRRR